MTKQRVLGTDCLTKWRRYLRYVKLSKNPDKRWKGPQPRESRSQCSSSKVCNLKQHSGLSVLDSKDHEGSLEAGTLMIWCQIQTHKPIKQGNGGSLVQSQELQMAHLAWKLSLCPGVRTLSHQGKYAQYPVCLFIKHGFSTYYVPGTEPSEACNTNTTSWRGLCSQIIRAEQWG